MATLPTNRMTLLDAARRLDPGGKVATIVEVLNEYNEILDDIPFVEGNLPTGHKVTIRSSLPVPTWRLLNKGVASTKSTTRQIVETCGMMEAYSRIDKDVAKLNGNTSDYRFSEDLAHIEGMNQALCKALIYGDTSAHPEQFVGLAPRYYSKTATVVTSVNIIDAGGDATGNTSIWLVGWSPQTITGIYPKGSQAGLDVKDLGELMVNDEDGNPYQAYVTHFQWKAGIAVKDWRFVVRIANVGVAALQTAGDTSDTSANIIKHMCMALDQLPPNGMVRPIFYCNKTVSSMLRVKILSKSNVYLTIEDLQGPSISRPTLKFMGVPVRRIDQILNTETQIT